MSEPKFREVINNNLQKLSGLTKLSTPLLDECVSTNIITSSDRRELESKLQNGDYEMNSHFYREILHKKDLGKFKLFFGVMQNENQSTDVLEILESALDSTDIEGDGSPVTKRPRPSIESPSSCSKFASIWFDVPEKINHFTGREKAMNQLHTEMLKQNDEGERGATVITTVSGLGGIGKTAFSIHYAWEYYTKFYNNVVWINSETESDIAESLGRLCSKINANFPKSKEPRATMHALYDSNQFDSSRSLFIFDNVDTFSDVKHYLPKRTPNKHNPYILITSRSQEWLENTNKFNLELLCKDACVQYFKNYLALESDAELKCASEISDYLRCLPLAIRQAGAYIKAESQLVKSKHEVMEEYISLLSTDPKLVLNFDYSSHTSDIYKSTVYTTWTITMNKIEIEVGPLAVKLMQVISLLSTTQIPFGLIENIPKSNISEIQKCIGCLLKYSMLSKDKSNGCISIHRLVQQVIQTNIESQSKYTVLDETISLVKYSLEYEQLINKYDQYQQICLIHAHHLALYIWRINLTEKYKPFLDYLDSTKALTVGHYSKIIEILLQEKKYDEVLTEFVLRLDDFRALPHEYLANKYDLSSGLHIQYASRLIDAVKSCFTGLQHERRNSVFQLYIFSMQFIENLSMKLGEEISQNADLAELWFCVAKVACSVSHMTNGTEIDKLFCQVHNHVCLKHILSLPVKYDRKVLKLCGQIATNLLNSQKYKSLIGLFKNLLDMTNLASAGSLTPASQSELFVIYIAEAVLHHLKYQRFQLAELNDLITETHAMLHHIFQGSGKNSQRSLYVANLMVCCLIILRKDIEINDIMTSVISTAFDISSGYFNTLKATGLLLCYTGDHFVLKYSKVKNSIINIVLHNYKIGLRHNPGDGIITLPVEAIHRFVICLVELARRDDFNFLVEELRNKFDKSKFHSRNIHVVSTIDSVVISNPDFASIKSSIRDQCSVFSDNLIALINSDLVSYVNSSRILVYLCSYLTRSCNNRNAFDCLTILILKLNQKLNNETWVEDIHKLPETLFKISKHPAQISESLTLQYLAFSIYRHVLTMIEDQLHNLGSSYRIEYTILSLYKSVLGLDLASYFAIDAYSKKFLQMRRQILNVLNAFCVNGAGTELRFDPECVRKELIKELLKMCNIEFNNTLSPQLKVDNLLYSLSNHSNEFAGLHYIMMAHGKKYRNPDMLRNAVITYCSRKRRAHFWDRIHKRATATATVVFLAIINNTEETLSYIALIHKSIKRVCQKKHQFKAKYLEFLPVIDALLESVKLNSTDKDKMVIQTVALAKILYSFQNKSKLYNDMQYTVELIITGLAELGRLKQITDICNDYQSTLSQTCGEAHDVTIRGVYAVVTRLFTLGNCTGNTDLIRESVRICKCWVEIAEENIGSDNWMVLWMRFVITESDEIRLTISNHIHNIATKNYHRRECLLALRRTAIVLKDCGYPEKSLQYLKFVVQKQKDNGGYGFLETCDTDLVVSLRALRDLQNQTGMRSEALDTHRYAQALIIMNYPETLQSECNFSMREDYPFKESENNFSLTYPLNYDSGPKLWLHDDFNQDIS